MRLPTRSHLERLTQPDSFFWATGIEDTCITTPHPRSGRTLDAYTLCGHYDHWQKDLSLIADLGVSVVRYGIPWHRIQPAPDVWDFTWADAPLQRLLDLGIEPIVDLIHYGLPSWLQGAWLDPRLPTAMATYARRVAERFAGRIFWWTPLNEPRTTAWYCGKIGWWPPNASGWRGFTHVLLAICRSIVLVCEALSDVDSENVHAHVDATDWFTAADEACQSEAAWRQELVFLALDLVSGRVDRRHPLHAWLLTHGCDEPGLAWFLEHALPLHVIGLNLYPLFSVKVVSRGLHGVRVRMPYGKPSIIGDLATAYDCRYQRPLWIAETASQGARRSSWLEDSVHAVAQGRMLGTGICGYTWWPLYTLISWGYRQGRLALPHYLRQMGLYDGDASWNRVPTTLTDAFRRHVAGGVPTLESPHVW